VRSEPATAVLLADREPLVARSIATAVDLKGRLTIQLRDRDVTWQWTFQADVPGA
jgi:hypothetical protein